jgi:serine/threonine protein kinase
MVRLSPGELIDEKYRLIRRVGEGGMGQAWLAEQTTIRGLRVVLKFITAGSHERFEREAQMLASLRHPNIVFVQDYQAASPGPYIVMEFVGEGTSLDGAKPYDSLEAVDIASRSSIVISNPRMSSWRTCRWPRRMLFDPHATM